MKASLPQFASESLNCLMKSSFLKAFMMYFSGSTVRNLFVPCETQFPQGLRSLFLPEFCTVQNLSTASWKAVFSKLSLCTFTWVFHCPKSLCALWNAVSLKPSQFIFTWVCTIQNPLTAYVDSFLKAFVMYFFTWVFHCPKSLCEVQFPQSLHNLLLPEFCTVQNPLTALWNAVSSKPSQFTFACVLHCSESLNCLM